MNLRWLPLVGLSLLVLCLGIQTPVLAQEGEPLTCPGAPPSQLVSGGRGRVTPGSANRMRATASTSGAEVGQIPGGERFLVLAGPVCADGFAWWEVDYHGVIGWTVEGAGEDYWVLPVPAADLVFASEGNGESGIFSVDVQGEHLTRLGDPDAYLSNPRVSPDGTQIAYLGLTPGGAGFLGVMDIDGNNPQMLFSGEQHGYAETIAWSPDSTQIVFVVDTDLAADADHMNLYMVNADGSNLHALTTGTVDHARPAWSPSGTQIVFAANYDGTSTNLHLLDVASGTVRQITTNPYTIGYIAWSPDGSAIGYIAFVPGASSPNTSQLFAVNADGSGERQPTGAGLHTDAFAWSPDGSSLVFTALRDGDADLELYTVKSDGSDLRRLTDNDAPESCPAWSPDGTQLAFISERDAADGALFRGDVYVMDASGEQVRRLTENERRDRCPNWIP